MAFNPRGIVIHHSASKDGVAYDWERLRSYHVEHNHWRDIGYHWGIERIGGVMRLHAGRLPTDTGAHVYGRNSEFFGVCLVGNFSLIPPPQDLLLYAAEFVSWLRSRVIPGSAPVPVYGHRELAATECPGKLFDLDKFRAMLH